MGVKRRIAIVLAKNPLVQVFVSLFQLDVLGYEIIDAGWSDAYHKLKLRFEVFLAKERRLIALFDLNCDGAI